MSVKTSYKKIEELWEKIVNFLTLNTKDEASKEDDGWIQITINDTEKIRVRRNETEQEKAHRKYTEAKIAAGEIPYESLTQHQKRMLKLAEEKGISFQEAERNLEKAHKEYKEALEAIGRKTE